MCANCARTPCTELPPQRKNRRKEKRDCQHSRHRPRPGGGALCAVCSLRQIPNTCPKCRYWRCSAYVRPLDLSLDLILSYRVGPALFITLLFLCYFLFSLSSMINDVWLITLYINILFNLIMLKNLMSWPSWRLLFSLSDPNALAFKLVITVNYSMHPPSLWCIS
jgi:hypothetical protein